MITPLAIPLGTKIILSCMTNFFILKARRRAGGCRPVVDRINSIMLCSKCDDSFDRFINAFFLQSLQRFRSFLSQISLNQISTKLRCLNCDLQYVNNWKLVNSATLRIVASWPPFQQKWRRYPTTIMHCDTICYKDKGPLNAIVLIALPVLPWRRLLTCISVNLFPLELKNCKWENCWETRFKMHIAIEHCI
jgi:hypothetical protein